MEVKLGEKRNFTYCKDMISFFPSFNCAGEKLALDYYYTAMNFK